MRVAEAKPAPAARSTGQRAFLWVVFCVVIANYLAQIPYTLHLYYFPHHVLPSVSATLLLGATLVWFLAGWGLLSHGGRLARGGYWLLLAFLLVEVVFYAGNMLTQVTHGYPPFMHLQQRDPVLWVVFAIGYLNLLGGVYFLYYLVRYHAALVEPDEG